MPTIPGYKASQAKINAKKVTPDTKDKTINISYAFVPKSVTESKDVTRTIIILNPDGTQTRIPQTITFTRTNTQTDAKGSIIYGQWDAGTNGGAWAAFTAPEIKGYKANPASIAKQVVTPTTKDTSDVITYAYIQKRVTETKDVCRVIIVVDPITGKQTRTVQTVTFTRTNIQTAADGSIRIGQWNGGSNDGYWNEFDAPEIKGYKPSQAKIDKEKVTPDTKEAVFVITYTKIDSGNTNPGGGNTPGGDNPTKPQPQPTTPVPIVPNTPTNPEQPTSPTIPTSPSSPVMPTQPTVANGIKPGHRQRAKTPRQPKITKRLTSVSNIPKQKQVIKKEHISSNIEKVNTHYYNRNRKHVGISNHIKIKHILKANALPQTGENNNLLLTLFAGISFIALGLAMTFKNRKRE